MSNLSTASVNLIEDRPDTFSGSYAPEEVTFLLKPVVITSTPVAEKEHLIQTQGVHYSELFTREKAPETDYMTLFWQALEQNEVKMAQHLQQLAANIVTRFENQTTPDEITLVSLARAGTPIGVLLKQILERDFSQTVAHYSVSIIRDRGIDANALQHILARHVESSLVFIDGWTGKGVISRELKRSIADFNRNYGTALNHDLYVLSDLSGTAYCAASCEDYLIPSAILNSTISGLISRSILNSDLIDSHDFHWCVYYHEFASIDLSRLFIKRLLDTVSLLDDRGLQQGRAETGWSAEIKSKLQNTSRQLIQRMQAEHGLHDINLIKPGIGEATRVLLRRMPGHLWVASKTAASVQHLLTLAESKQVPVTEAADLPYQAVAIIEETL